MIAVLASMVAVVGTLLGSLSTYVFQQRIAVRAEANARAERLRQERIAAYGAYATAITELKRGVISAWFHRADLESPAFRTAMAESDRLGAAAESARFRVFLVSPHSDLHALADAAFDRIGAFRDATNRAELRACEDAFEVAVGAFITTAATHVQ